MTFFGLPTNYVSEAFWTIWSNIATIFSVFIIAGLIPLFQLLQKHHTKRMDEKREKEKENIRNVAREVTYKLDEKLNNHIVRQEQANYDTMTAIKDLCARFAKTETESHEILTMLKLLSDTFRDFKDEQIAINSKVEFVDRTLRDHIFHSSNNNNKKE